jgi:hypothetical protein
LVPAATKSTEDKIDLREIRRIARSFKAKVKGSFSSGDINDILYDEDGLPK